MSKPITNAPPYLTQRERLQRVVTIFQRSDGRFGLQLTGVEILVRAGAGLGAINNRTWDNPGALIQLCERFYVFYEIVEHKPTARRNDAGEGAL